MTYQHFSVEEREKIQEGLWTKQSYREIARNLGRSTSSVSREIRRTIQEWILKQIREASTPVKEAIATIDAEA